MEGGSGMIAYDENGRERLPVHLPEPGAEPKAGHWPTRCGRWVATARMQGAAHEDSPPCRRCVLAATHRHWAWQKAVRDICEDAP